MNKYKWQNLFLSDVTKTKIAKDSSSEESEESDSENESFTAENNNSALVDVDESKNSENIVKDTEQVKGDER